jgi:ABC-2 type transport system permease protein
MRSHPVLAIVAANLRTLARDRVGLFFVLVMPFVIITLVGLSAGDGTGERGKLPIGLVGQADGELAREIRANLAARPDIVLTELSDVHELRQKVRQGTLAAGLVLPTALDGNGDTYLPFIAIPGTGEASGARVTVDAAVSAAEATNTARLAAQRAGATVAQADVLIREEAQPVSLDNRTPASTEPPTEGFAYAAPGNLVLFTFVNSITLATALVESRRLGITRRALVAPVRPAMVLLGEATGRFLLAAVQSVLVIAGSAALFGVHWGDPLGVALMTGVFCLVATGAAMLVGSLVRSPTQASVFGPPIGIVMAMLGGCMWPREVMGGALDAVGHVFPHSWAVDGLLALTVPGGSVGAVLPELAVLTAMALALSWPAIHLFRRSVTT